MSLTSATLSALLNVVLLAGVPFLGYGIYHKWRHGRTLAEIARRAGLQMGETRYLLYALGFSLLVIAVLLIWPPSLELYLRRGSAQRVFKGLGLSGVSMFMAILFGFVKTGFPEEFLFRGLIAGSLFRRMPTVWANLIQAAIFLTPHVLVLFVMPALWFLLPLIYLGALFVGWLRAESGSMLGPWLVHGLLNATVCLSVAIRSAA